MPDTITITCERPAKAETITVTVPEELVLMLDWLAASTVDSYGEAYLYGLNVLWRDAIQILVPRWRERYAQGHISDLEAQLRATRKQIEDAVAAGVDALGVTGDESYKVGISEPADSGDGV